MISRELIEEILKDISTPTGISYSGDKTIANSTVDNILEFIDDLQKKAELADHYKHLYSEVKKQKDDVVEYIKKHFQDEGTGIVCKYVGDKCCEVNENFIDELLRMLGEIDVED